MWICKIRGHNYTVTDGVMFLASPNPFCLRCGEYPTQTPKKETGDE